MTYYNQTDASEIKKMKSYLESIGFAVDIQNTSYEIKRETSKYNKYMKWHVLLHLQTGSISSEYFKTQKAAIEFINRPRRPMPIGERLILSYYSNIN